MSYVQTMAKALRHYGAVNPTAKKPPRIQVRAPRAGLGQDTTIGRMLV